MTVQPGTCEVTLTHHLENRGLAWVIGSFLFCPCHLPLTLGLAATLLAGTSAGALLRGHPYVAGAIITVTWVAGTWRGFHHLRAARRYARAAVNHAPGVSPAEPQS